MAKQYIVLLRHGQSQWNLENRFTGFEDVALSPKGVEEAIQAGQSLKQADIQLDLAFTSTLQRAATTAEIALKTAQQDNVVDAMVRHDDLRERDYGDLTGQNKDEARAEFGEEQVRIWRRSYDIAPPNGESLQDVVENRIRPYYTSSIKPLLDKGNNILVAAHGNSLRALLIVLGQETPQTINNAEIYTGVPLVFEIENGKIVKHYTLDQKAA